MEPKSEKVKFGSQEIGWHVWQQHTDDDDAAATGPLIILFHGFLAHGRYPTVRYAAELCATHLAGCTVVAADMPGHGTSDGLRGYLSGAPGLVTNFGCQVLATARQKYDPQGQRKVFLMGSSMGGTIALQVALAEPPTTTPSSSSSIAGVVLLAPMLKLNVSTLEAYALQGLAALVPTWQIIPSSSTSAEKQYRDADKRAACETDALAIQGSKIRVGSAWTCVQLARTILPTAGVGNDDVSSRWTQFPVWNGVADQDVVVDKQGSFELDTMIREAGGSSTMVVYPALHGLLCEPPPLFDQITNDILKWIKERL